MAHKPVLDRETEVVLANILVGILSVAAVVGRFSD